MLHRATPCGCEKEIGMSKAHQPQTCEHGNLFQYVKKLAVSEAPKPRKARKPMRRKGSMSADPKQQAKVAGLPCANCGREAGGEWAIDAAHLWPRSLGGCSHPDCVLPLCRNVFKHYGCHPALDSGDLDILARLVDRGYFKEMAHAIEAHELSPLTLLKRLTGNEWVETESPEREAVR